MKPDQNAIDLKQALMDLEASLKDVVKNINESLKGKLTDSAMVSAQLKLEVSRRYLTEIIQGFSEWQKENLTSKTSRNRKGRTEGTEKKGGHNPPNTSNVRPPKPGGKLPYGCSR